MGQKGEEVFIAAPASVLYGRKREQLGQLLVNSSRPREYHGVWYHVTTVPERWAGIQPLGEGTLWEAEKRTACADTACSQQKELFQEKAQDEILKGCGKGERGPLGLRSIFCSLEALCDLLDTYLKGYVNLSHKLPGRKAAGKSQVPSGCEGLALSFWC